MTSNDILEKLNSEEREYVLSVLKEISTEGKSDKFNELMDADYSEYPVDINTFMHDRKYLGNALYDAEGKFTVYPYWENKLNEIFPTPTTTAYNTIVLTGAIGLGKSTIAVICLLYMLYRLLCLKDPYIYYGLQPIDKISISLMNITIENAKGVALDKMNQMILASEWFMSHGKMTGISNLTYEPAKHIELIAASSNNQIIGRALFCLDGDTIIATSGGDKKLKDIVNKPIRVLTIGDNNELTLSDECYVLPTLISREEIDIELEDGTYIKCTPNHLLKLKNGSYKEAGLLTVEDELYDIQADLTYDLFIENIIKTRGQWNIPKDEYFEVHHIKPICLGGEPSGKALTKKVKYSEHPNLIWLYPQEHYIAHKLLFEKYPEEYGLYAALIGTTANFTLSAEEFANIKNYRHYLPEDIVAKIPTEPFHYKPRKISKRKTDRDVSKYIACQKKRREAGICKTRGKDNGMYGKGYLISGGRNGHASIRYFYKNLVFESRKELLEYLQSINIKITSSAIRAVIHNKATLRVYNMYKEVFDNLRWEYKE